MSTAPHPYAHILRAIADGQNVQFQESSGKWINQSRNDTLGEITRDSYGPARYRVHDHVPTITINGREVPEPLREMPPLGTLVFWPSFGPSARDDKTDGIEVGYYPVTLPILLLQGLLHATREAAIAHAEALISITAGKS